MKSYWPSLLCLALIVYATWFPHPLPSDSLPSIPHIDKLIHAVMFGGFAGAIMFDFRRSGHQLRLANAAWIAAGVGLFAVVDEVVQESLANGRAFEWLDIVADWVGIAVAVATAPPLIRAIFRNRSV